MSLNTEFRQRFLGYKTKVKNENSDNFKTFLNSVFQKLDRECKMRNQLGAASSKASCFGQKINQEFVKNLKPPAGKWQCKNGQKFSRCTKNT